MEEQVSDPFDEDSDNPSNSDRLFDEESVHLDATLGMIKEAINRASVLLDNTEDNYQQVKSYMVDYRGEIDPSEQYQNELFLYEVDRQNAQAYHAKDRLGKLLDSPYFARVSFQAFGDPDATIAYIGRFAFYHDATPVISDWRSPIAGLFYDFEAGPAAYEAPSGRIEGELQGKRQYKIDQGKLVYAIESASSVRDEVLQQELSRTSDQKMKSIISSIQQEQNRVIRDEATGTLVIQGAAGSGKTSIALHRVAYLLYRRKETLNSRSVAILSPNRVFSDYISSVLPELGEEPINEICLQDIFSELLDETVRIEPANSPVDCSDPAWHKRVQFKGSFEFVDIVFDYLEKALGEVFRGERLAFGRYVLEPEWLEERFFGYTSLPVYERINALASDIILDMSSQLLKLGVQSLPTKGQIRTKLTKMLTSKDALSLYRKFYQDIGSAALLSRPEKGAIEWEDAAPLVCFQMAFNELRGYSDIEHLVIDEMQDLTPIQHTMLARLFSCEKTILGDYHQMVDPGNHMNLDAMQTTFPDARVFKLERSYRSTTEIMELAKKVKNIPELESVERHGEQPIIEACGDTRGILQYLDQAISEFEKGSYRTLGILHKSEVLAQRYHELLARDHEINLISPESTTFENGVSVASVKMAKGLEFDEVIILDVDDLQYSTDFDRNLLYVAITRAMHKLSLLYRTKLSPFLS